MMNTALKIIIHACQMTDRCSAFRCDNSKKAPEEIFHCLFVTLKWYYKKTHLNSLNCVSRRKSQYLNTHEHGKLFILDYNKQAMEHSCYSTSVSCLTLLQRLITKDLPLYMSRFLLNGESWLLPWRRSLSWIEIENTHAIMSSLFLWKWRISSHSITVGFLQMLEGAFLLSMLEICDLSWFTTTKTDDTYSYWSLTDLVFIFFLFLLVHNP